jgi:hypothetical protein
MVQGRKDRVPEPAEVWGLARAETKAAVAAGKAEGLDAVAAAAQAVVVAKGKVAAPDVRQTARTNPKPRQTRTGIVVSGGDGTGPAGLGRMARRVVRGL